MSFYQFQVPTKIIFDAGISRDFAHECELLGLSKLFVVTDKQLIKMGLCDPILNSLKAQGINIVGIFDEVPPDSSVQAVEDCANKAKKCDAKGFLAIGGGSVMDTAKGANILFTLGGHLKEDYSGAQTISQKLSPLIAIPTTAGTGSEVTEAFVVYDEESQSKLSFVDHHVLPTLAVLDPELTTGLPSQLTAATGLDALTHAMEAVMSVQNGPVSDALAFQAIHLIHKSLIHCVQDGSDLQARSDLLIAANLAGMAFNHSMVGVVHAVAHSVGGVAHVHHGTANGIFLPYGLEYNSQDVPERIASMAKCFGLSELTDVHQTVQQVIQAVQNLLNTLHQKCGLPICYKDAGVKEEDLERIADMAVEDGASFYNPRPVDSKELMPYLLKAFQKM